MPDNLNNIVIKAALLVAGIVLGISAYRFVVPTASDAAPTMRIVEPATSPAERDERAVLMVVGDSLSAGFGLADVDQGWVALLQQRLEQNDYPVRVVNASISGDTTGGGLARLPRALETHQPDIVIIELGGNDGLRGLPLEVMRSNLQQMIEASRDAGATPILFGIMIPPNYGQRYTDEFVQQFADLSKRYDITLVPFFLQDVALNPALMQDDGIHPGAAAQPIMLEHVWPAIEPVVVETLASTP